jgi:hypothetical protein
VVTAALGANKLMTGVVAYVGRIYPEAKGRPLDIVESAPSAFTMRLRPPDGRRGTSESASLRPGRAPARWS